MDFHDGQNDFYGIFFPYLFFSALTLFFLDIWQGISITVFGIFPGRRINNKYEIFGTYTVYGERVCGHRNSGGGGGGGAHGSRVCAFTSITAPGRRTVAEDYYTYTPRPPLK